MKDHFGSLIHHMVLEITLGSHFRLRSHFFEILSVRCTFFFFFRFTMAYFSILYTNNGTNSAIILINNCALNLQPYSNISLIIITSVSKEMNLLPSVEDVCVPRNLRPETWQVHRSSP